MSIHCIHTDIEYFCSTSEINLRLDIQQHACLIYVHSTVKWAMEAVAISKFIVYLGFEKYYKIMYIYNVF